MDNSSERFSSSKLRNVKNIKQKFPVMFTSYVATSSNKELISQLQGSVTESMTECNVLMTDKIKRTAKFLSMVARGVPIVYHLGSQSQRNCSN